VNEIGTSTTILLQRFEFAADAGVCYINAAPGLVVPEVLDRDVFYASGLPFNALMNVPGKHGLRLTRECGNNPCAFLYIGELLQVGKA
jgi:hypothetical protein